MTVLKNAENRSLTVTAPKRLRLLAVSCRFPIVRSEREMAFFGTRPTDAAPALMRVAQGLGRQFTEEETVIPGEPAEVPNAELRGNFGDAGTRRVGGLERPPNLVECSPVEILHRCCAEVAQEGIPKCSLGNAGRTGELFHGEVLAIVLGDEIH